MLELFPTERLRGGDMRIEDRHWPVRLRFDVRLAARGALPTARVKETYPSPPSIVVRPATASGVISQASRPFRLRLRASSTIGIWKPMRADGSARRTQSALVQSRDQIAVRRQIHAAPDEKDARLAETPKQCRIDRAIEV